MPVTARIERSHGARSHGTSSAMSTRLQQYLCPDQKSLRNLSVNVNSSGMVLHTRLLFGSAAAPNLHTDRRNPTMLEIQPRDKRGYFMLPQAPEDAGYYVYGTPVDGAGQYADPVLLSVIFFVERHWQTTEKRKFGVGNISQAGGIIYGKHSSHKDGLQMDIRALRADGLHLPVTRFDRQYDQQATKRLIEIFYSHPAVKKILFNDKDIPRVQYWLNHDDHFHVDIRATPK